MDKTELDNNIKQLRKQAHAAEEYSTAMFILKELNNLQRQRQNKFGKFLSAGDGKLYTYDPDWDMWLSWSV